MFLKKSILIKVFAFPFLFLVSLFLFLSLIPNLTKPSYAATCRVNTTIPVTQGFTINVGTFGLDTSLPTDLVLNTSDGSPHIDLGKITTASTTETALAADYQLSPTIPIGTYNTVLVIGSGPNPYILPCDGGVPPLPNPNIGAVVQVIAGAKNWNDPGSPPPPFNIMDVFQPAKRFGSFGQLASDVLLILVSLAGALAVIFIIISGFKFLTSGGDEKKLASARATLTYAIIGIAVVILAFVIVQILQYFLQSSIPIT